jgi:hypothetical protein
MNIKTLTPEEYARLLKDYPVVQVSVAVGGYVYAVIQGDKSEDVYRMAVA